MRSRPYLTLLAVLLTAFGAVGADRSEARGGRGDGGGRSGGGGSVSRPSAGSNRASVSRPAQTRPSPSISRPSGNRGSSAQSRPQASRPATRPSTPQRPSSGSAGSGFSRPTQKPTQRPSLNAPATRPAQRPGTARPVTRPTERPGTARPGTKPTERPGSGGDRPFVNLPGEGNRPGAGNRPGGGNLVGNRPPGQGNTWRPSRPDGRPGRPDRDDTFINTGNITVGNTFNHHFNNVNGGIDRWHSRRSDHWRNWDDAHRARLEDFRHHRNDRWDHRLNRRVELWDHRADRREDWLDWREDVWDFRRDRADDIRDFVRDSRCHYFTSDWFRARPWWRGGQVHVSINPWWWWRPVVWNSWAFFWVNAPPPPIIYDYGTDILITSEVVYVDGEEYGSAPEYRESAIALANPSTQPPPPVPESEDDQNLIPLGVWALVQENMGDAIMFYQLAATRDGLITGSYSNVLTGDSSPVTGSFDRKSQRVAFHTGDNGDTVIECNMHGLTKDQVGVFVHFGDRQTQEWLLVRMPNPELPDASAPVPAARP